MGSLLISETFDSLLEEQIGSVPVDLRPLIPGFLERREKELLELRRLLKANDFVGIRYIGHKLKGTGGGFGLPVITDIGHELEAAALAEDSKRAGEFIGHLANVIKFLKLHFGF